MTDWKPDHHTDRHMLDMGDSKPLTRKNLIRFIDAIYERRAERKLTTPPDLVIIALSGPRFRTLPDDAAIVVNCVEADPVVAATAAAASLRSITSRDPGTYPYLEVAVDALKEYLGLERNKQQESQ